MDDVVSRLSWRQLMLLPLSLALLWPAFINGSPFIFPDTSAYIRSLDAIVLRVFDHTTTWSNDDVHNIVRTEIPDKPDATSLTNWTREDNSTTKPVLLGRSIFYGILAYSGALLGTLWITVLAQAIFVGAVLMAFLRFFVDPAQKRKFAIFYSLTIATLTTTPLAFYTSMIMPDVFAGTTIIAATALATNWRRETRFGRLFWGAAAGYGALVHSSHVLILIIVAAVALCASWRWRSMSRAGILVICAAACMGVGGDALFSAAVRFSTGDAPIRPPFITARLVDDGPGTAYLHSSCDRPVFLLCKYRDRLPLPSDGFLWRTDKAGVFKAVPVSEQRTLADEQTRFVASVIADRPFDVASSTVLAIKRQALLWRLPEFDQSSWDARAIAAKLPLAERTAFIQSAAYGGTVPTEFTSAMVPVWFMLGLGMAIGAPYISRTQRSGRESAFLVLGWAANILICGALSTPHDRYQARVIWLFAVIVLISASSYHLKNDRRKSARAEPSDEV